MPGISRSLLAGSMLVASLVVWLGASAGAQTSTAPGLPERPKYSTRAADAAPQMQKSLEVQIRLVSFVTSNPEATAEVRQNARRLCQEAYALQRAAHAGIDRKLHRRSLPQYAEAIKAVDQSRRLILNAGTRFGRGSMAEGLDFIRAAMTQTRIALALIE